MNTTAHVLIIGAGHAGFGVAKGLKRAIARGVLTVTVVNPTPYMTYKPLLPEVAGGDVNPRDIMVDLRRALPRCAFFEGQLDGLDTDRKTATVTSVAGDASTMAYDHVVITAGSITHAIRVPGIDVEGIGFSTIEEAVYLRNHILDMVSLAAATSDPEERKKKLTFVFVGGGYTGVEAIAELNDLALSAMREYPELAESRSDWKLVEAADQVAAELGPTLARWTLGHLRGRGIEVDLGTTMTCCTDGNIELDNGEKFSAGTVVWTAGVRPSPIIAETGLPLDEKGHVTVNSQLQVAKPDGTVIVGVWAAGDNARVPDPMASNQPAFYPPNAQNAVRQAALLAANIQCALAAKRLQPYRHKSLGTMASYGPGRGAALVKGLRLRGWPAWFLAHGYHDLAMPDRGNRARLLAGWATNTLLPRRFTSTSAIEHPRQPLKEALEAAKQKSPSKRIDGNT